MNEETRLYAYCFPSGEIGFGNPVPKRAIAFCEQAEDWAKMNQVEMVARYEPEGVYVVPGMNGASDPQAALDALARWIEQNAPAWREAGLFVFDAPKIESEELENFFSALAAGQRAAWETILPEELTAARQRDVEAQFQQQQNARKQGAECSHLFNWILIELADAEAMHPVWPTDAIHAAAILAEESGELVQAAIDFHYGRPSKNEINRGRIREEAIQVGAMAIRVLKHLHRYETNLRRL